ncbi:uL15 family ribosomal protein [Candidatus Woesearchaeota archaeon]|nr:uL15 family ribosomal protein [Candidatus Woesearchaeota archaeon]
MVVNKRKKFSRMRGSHTHGWGSKKKHRGSGNRGGFGMAGTGKKADQRKTQIWQDPHYFGKYGFTPLRRLKSPCRAINIDDMLIMAGISEKAQKSLKVMKKEKGTKEKDSKEKKSDVSSMMVIDLTKQGYDKLLGRGALGQKVKVIVKFASANAVEKITGAGGEIILSTQAGKNGNNKKDNQ